MRPSSLVHALEIRKAQLGANDNDTLIGMEELAKLYDLEEAEQLSMSTIETRNAQFSENHPNTLTSIGKFAGAYRKQGRLEEAEQLAMQVMETYITDFERPYIQTKRRPLIDRPKDEDIIS